MYVRRERARTGGREGGREGTGGGIEGRRGLDRLTGRQAGRDEQ